MTRAPVLAARAALAVPAVLTVLLVLVASPGLARDLEHAAFTAGVKRPGSFVILPTQSSLVRGKVNEAEPLIKEAEALEEELASSTAAALRALGYDVRRVEPERLAEDDELRDALDLVLTRASEVFGNIVSRPKDLREGRFTLGDAVLPLGRMLDAEGFVLATSKSLLPSKGRRALSGVVSTLFGGLPYVPRSKTQLLVMEIDAFDGDVLALRVATEAGAVLKNPDKVADRLVREAFRDHPRRSEIGRVPSRHDDVVAEARAEQERREETVASRGDADDVIAAFEAAAAKTERARDETERARDDDSPVESVDGATGEPVNRLRREDPRAPDISSAPTERRADVPVEDVAPRDEFLAPEQDVAAAALEHDAQRMLDTPRDARPAPTVTFSLQVVAAGEDAGERAGLSVTNATGRDLLVSVEGGDFFPLAPGEEATGRVSTGSPRVLVAEPSGREAGRVAALTRRGATVRIDIHEKGV